MKNRQPIRRIVTFDWACALAFLAICLVTSFYPDLEWLGTQTFQSLGTRSVWREDGVLKADHVYWGPSTSSVLAHVDVAWGMVYVKPRFLFMAPMAQYQKINVANRWAGDGGDDQPSTEEILLAAKTNVEDDGWHDAIVPLKQGYFIGEPIPWVPGIRYNIMLLVRVISGAMVLALAVRGLIKLILASKAACRASRCECGQCGYSLKGLSQEEGVHIKCPECGQPAFFFYRVRFGICRGIDWGCFS